MTYEARYSQQQQGLLPLFALGLIISNITSTHPVLLKRDQWYRTYRTDKHSLGVWNLHYVEHCNQIFLQDTPAYNDALSS